MFKEVFHIESGRLDLLEPEISILGTKYLRKGANLSTFLKEAMKINYNPTLMVGIEKKPMNYAQFKALEPFEFEKATVRHIGGVTNQKQVADGGTDGRLSFDGTPIQVKKSERIGRNVLDNFHKHMSSHGRGIVIALSFGKGAKEEAARLRREEKIDIQLLTLTDIIKGKCREQPLPEKAA